MQGDLEGDGEMESALEKPSGHHSIPFVPNNVHPDIMDRYRDMAIYHTLIDAGKGGEDFYLVGMNLFKPNQKRPPVDKIDADRRLVVKLLRR